MTDVGDAEALIRERIRPLPARRVTLADAAGGILREPVYAERDQPPFDRVTMDGIAIASSDWRDGVRSFEVVGLQAAGAPPLTITAPGQCVEIMTGAMLPTGADAIIPVERITRKGEHAHVEPDLEITARQFIHPQGSDGQAGRPLLESGTVLNPPEVAILASAGCAEIEIDATPRVAVISTGDELIEPGRPVAAHQIRSSNEWAIAAALQRCCRADVTRTLLKDEREVMLARIGALHDDNDVLVLSGGVSMGR
ncbi:MAG: molybdopterin molybdenumtransferase MoeA, partial [Gammaproteobacteria bacterium]|nr:molybdopterin molybdenumtransferase MoeA [Gammaproteobacteria bacterium]